MTKIGKMAGMTMAALFVVLGANATTVTLTADADVFIQSAPSDNTGYNRNYLIAAVRDTKEDAKIYVRFKLPGDFGSATAATFKIERYQAGKWSPTYSVNGLNDGVAGETGWVEADGTGKGTTWDNAPGNDTNSPNGFVDSAEVGSFAVVGSSSGGGASTNTVSGTNLVDFVNADSNGYVTLMISRLGENSDSMDFFASKERDGYVGPTLELEYTPIPSKTVELGADADAYIQSAPSDNIGYNRDYLLAAVRESKEDAKIYVRFKLPSDFDKALSATFTLTRYEMGAWNPTYSVNGLNDGVTGETDWVEADGTGKGTTWDNAPGNDTNSDNGFVDSVEVGQFTVHNTDHGGVVGDRHTVTGAALVDFMNKDSNGYVTLMISRLGDDSDSLDFFASRTYPTNSWRPTLTLQYSTALPSYEAWIGRYPGVGSATNLTDNPDNDSLDNLAEWAMGGNPDDPNDTGHPSAVRIVAEGGTNWLEYVYAKRNDAEASGLTYYLEQSTDLGSPVWTNDNYEVGGTGVLDGEFDTVTNRIPTDMESRQFLRLRIESN